MAGPFIETENIGLGPSIGRVWNQEFGFGLVSFEIHIRYVKGIVTNVEG